MSLVLAKRMRLRSANFRRILRPNTFVNRLSPLLCTLSSIYEKEGTQGVLKTPYLSLICLCALFVSMHPAPQSQTYTYTHTNTNTPSTSFFSLADHNECCPLSSCSCALQHSTITCFNSGRWGRRGGGGRMGRN